MIVCSLFRLLLLPFSLESLDLTLDDLSPQVHPTVDFRQVSVHDLPHMRFVHDRPGALPTPDGGRLEWIEDGDDEAPQQEGAMQE